MFSVIAEYFTGYNKSCWGGEPSFTDIISHVGGEPSFTDIISHVGGEPSFIDIISHVGGEPSFTDITRKSAHQSTSLHQAQDVSRHAKSDLWPGSKKGRRTDRRCLWQNPAG